MKPIVPAAALAALAVAAQLHAQPQPAPAPAQAQPGSRVLYVHAAGGGDVVTCVASSSHTEPCSSAPGPRFLDSLNAVKLRVVGRKFLTDYFVEITATTQVEAGRIRGVEEAAGLTIGTQGQIAPPPAKGPLPAIEPRSATQLLTRLLDEAEAAGIRAAFDADAAELQRQLLGVQALVEAIAEMRARVEGAQATCAETAGAPTMLGVWSCLETTLTEQHELLGSAPFTSEPAFRHLLVTATDRQRLVASLQQALNASPLSARIREAVEDVTQLQKNEATFAANAAAAQTAIAMYTQLASHREARKALRREQIRLLFRAQFKATGGDAAAVDEAELNALVEEYVEFVAAGFSTADARVAALGPHLATHLDNSQHRTTAATGARAGIATHDTFLRVTLPDQVAAVNTALGRLLTLANHVYDRSEISEPLEKVIDLSAYKGANTFGYAVRRVEGFTRFVVSAAPRVDASKPVTAAVPSLPVTLPGAAPPTPAAADDGAPPEAPGEIVARGTFELHQYDRASVVAGYVLTSLAKRSYGSQQRPATADTPAGLYPIVTSESGWNPQVLLGLNYYLRPRDVHPSTTNTHFGLSNIGVLAGVSLTDLNNYFAGVLVEPKVGFNVGVGAHFGTTTEIQAPYAALTTPLPDATVPTFEKRAVGFYIHAGLDVDIFRKVFGKAAGVGAAAAAHPR